MFQSAETTEYLTSVFKTATLDYKLLHSGPTVPDLVTLIVNTVPPFHSLVYKSVKLYGHRLLLMLP